MYPNMAPAGTPASNPGQGAGYSVPVNLPGPTQNGEVHPTVGTLGMPPQPQQQGNPTLPTHLPPTQGQQGYVQQPYAGPGTSFPHTQAPQAPQQPQFQGAPQYGQPTGVTHQGQPITQQPYQPQQPQQPQSQPGRVELSDSVILDGPAVPEELRGRTMGQFKQIYQALVTDWMHRNPQGQPISQPTAPVQPQGQPQGQEDDFWNNPAGFVRRAVQEAVAPVTQQALGAQIAQARQIATQGVPDFAQLEGDVVSLLSIVDEATRATPQAWVNAMDLARGRMIRSGQYNRQQVQQPAQQANQYPTMQQPSQQQFGAVPTPFGGPGNAVPATQVPLYGFFSESPTPPPPQQSGQPTQQDAFYAQKFGMDLPSYMAWKAAQVGRV